MHYISFVTLNKTQALTNKQARIKAFDWLIGKLCEPADRAVVGGRFSGYLQMKNKQLWDMLRENNDVCLEKTPFGIFLGSDEVDKKKLLFQKIWRDIDGVGISPFLRNRYRLYGYEDDAVVVNHHLYYKFLLSFCKKTRKEIWNSLSVCGYWLDMNEDLVSEKFIGKKWLVIIDVHE